MQLILDAIQGDALHNPLAVDLDGTLIFTDMLHECVFKLVREDPFALLRIPLWLLQGKSHLKRELADRVNFDPSLLPYNEAFIEWLRGEKKAVECLFFVLRQIRV